MKRGASGDRSPVGDQELVLPYPALNIRFGVSFVIVSFVSVVLGMLAAVCLWLSVLCVNQILVLAGWGWDDFFVDLSASWLPVAGGWPGGASRYVDGCLVCSPFRCSLLKESPAGPLATAVELGVRGQRPTIQTTPLSLA